MEAILREQLSELLLKIFPSVVVQNILEKLTNLYRREHLEHKEKLYKSIKWLVPDLIFDSNIAVFEHMQLFKQVSGNVKIKLKVHHLMLLTRSQANTQKKIRDEYLEKLNEQSFD